MFLLFRTLAYATLFISFILVYLPARVLAWAGVVRPVILGWPQIGGWIVGSVGAIIALCCVFAFTLIGKGTPAPFDPPRRLVVRGPYRFLRNPMYLGAALALAGAALFYKSMALLGFVTVFLLAAHLMVVMYEEPTLRRSFGQEYADYCHAVRRWFPVAHPSTTR